MKLKNIKIGDVLKVKKGVKLNWGGDSFLPGKAVVVTKVEGVEVYARVVDRPGTSSFSFLASELKRTGPKPERKLKPELKVGDKVMLKDGEIHFGAFHGLGGFEVEVVRIDGKYVVVKGMYDGRLLNQTVSCKDIV